MAIDFPSDVCSSSLISRYIDVPMLEDVNAPYIYPIFSMYAAGRCKLENWSTDLRGTVTALEVVTPNLPNDEFLTREESRKKFIMSSCHVTGV